MVFNKICLSSDYVCMSSDVNDSITKVLFLRGRCFAADGGIVDRVANPFGTGGSLPKTPPACRQVAKTSRNPTRLCIKFIFCCFVHVTLQYHVCFCRKMEYNFVFYSKLCIVCLKKLLENGNVHETKFHLKAEAKCQSKMRALASRPLEPTAETEWSTVVSSVGQDSS